MAADRPANPKAPHYPEVDPSPDFPAMEREIIARWQAEGTFAASVEGRPAGEKGSNEYVFYDGPPSPTACPTTAT